METQIKTTHVDESSGTNFNDLEEQCHTTVTNTGDFQ